MYVIDVLKEFVNELNEFLGNHKESVCEAEFYILAYDTYIPVDMRISYWRLEDDGTLVFVVNDLDELEFING